MIVSIELQQLLCLNQLDGATNPFLWVELLQVDDDTLQDGALVASVSFPPSPIGAAVVIKTGMGLGDSASIPDVLRRYGAQFRPGETTRVLILVAALWDRRDLPFDAMVAGYDVFLGGVRDAVAANLFELNALQDAHDTVGLMKLEGDIADSLRPQVEAAIRSKLSTVEEIELWLGTDTRDRLIATTFRQFSLAETSATIDLTIDIGKAPTPTDQETDFYHVTGTLVSTVDVCEAENIRVIEIMDNIANTRGALDHVTALPETPKTLAEAEMLTAELLDQEKSLANAKAELALCLEGFPMVGAEGGLPTKKI